MGQIFFGLLVFVVQIEFEIICDQFWLCLKFGQFDGYYFEYRVCIVGYLVDFCCEIVRLLIDIYLSEGVDLVLFDECWVVELEVVGYFVFYLWEQDLCCGLDLLFDFICQVLCWWEFIMDIFVLVCQLGYC